jgi:ABC-type enterochelin transport system permease subunit
MKNPLFPSHTATLLQYIGIGLISGAISHGFFSGFRSFITAVIGIIIFVIGLMYERHLAGSKVDMGRVLLIGIIFSISTAMVAGGFQHFLDSPWRSAWIIPVGYFISLLAFREKGGIKNSFSNTLSIGVMITLLISIIAFPLASITPAQFDDHHASEMGSHDSSQND